MLFNFKMNMSKSMDKNIDEFTRLTLLLRGIDQALGDINEAMILLNCLPDEYNVVKHALQYTRIIPSLDLVISGIKARVLKLNTLKNLVIIYLLNENLKRRTIWVMEINMGVLGIRVKTKKRRVKKT